MDVFGGLWFFGPCRRFWKVLGGFGAGCLSVFPDLCSPTEPGIAKENIWTAASDGDVSRVEALMALEGFMPSSKEHFDSG